MGVSRAGYYKWPERGQPIGNKRQRAIEAVAKAHAEHPSHGYRWICACLRINGIIEISENFTYKIFRFLGIRSETKHKVHHKPRKIRDRFPNLIFSTWETVDRPFQVIVSDMTAFHTRYGRYYEVTFYFDVFMKQILSWSLAERRGDRRQYIDGLEQVIAILEASVCIDPVILHTDQGSVYASQAYNELIENTVITRSMSRAGKPTDNPVNESLNGWIKEELMTDFHLAESHDLKQTITRYVDFYNTERPAYSLGYMTPKMFYKAFMDGKIEHRDTFSNRELSEIPKFVRKKMKEKAELNSIKTGWAWRKEDIPPSVEEPLSTFEKTTE